MEIGLWESMPLGLQILMGVEWVQVQQRRLLEGNDGVLALLGGDYVDKCLLLLWFRLHLLGAQ